MGVAASVGAFSVLAACGGESEVVTAEVGLETVTEVVEAPATVSARSSADVTAPADGRVVTIMVKDGQRVQPGTPLLQIDSPDARDRLARAEEALAAAVSAQPSGGGTGIDLSGLQAHVDEAAREAFEAAYEAARAIEDPELREAALERVAAAEDKYLAARDLAREAVAAVNQGAGAASDALASLSAAQVRQAEAAVSAAQDVVDSLLVRAPIQGRVQLTTGGQAAVGGVDDLLSSLPPELAGIAGGVVGSSSGTSGPVAGVPTNRRLRIGQPVTTGSTVAIVVDAAQLSLAAEVDETDVLLVAPGVPARVQVDAAPGAEWAATVTSVDAVPVTSARGGVSYRTVLALGPGTMGEGEAEQAAPQPRPGMSAIARLQVRRAEGVVAVPVSAVVRDGGEDVVWVDSGGEAERRPVTLGAQGEDSVEVVSGLKAGETVVVSGADKVTEGQDLG